MSAILRMERAKNSFRKSLENDFEGKRYTTEGFVETVSRDQYGSAAISSVTIDGIEGQRVDTYGADIGAGSSLILENYGTEAAPRWRMVGIGPGVATESRKLIGNNYDGTQVIGEGGIWVSDGCIVVGGDHEEGEDFYFGNRVVICDDGVRGFAGPYQQYMSFGLFNDYYTLTEDGVEYEYGPGDSQLGYNQFGNLKVDALLERLTWNVGPNTIIESYLVGDDPITLFAGLVRAASEAIGEGVEFGTQPGGVSGIWLRNEYNVPVIMMRAGDPEDLGGVYARFGPLDPLPNMTITILADGTPFLSIDGGTIRASTIDADTLNVDQLSAIAANMGTLTAGKIDVGSIEINADTERILLGAATAPMTGVGIFIGKDGAAYKFRAGDPAADYMHWNGTDLDISGNIISATDGSGLLQLDGGNIQANTVTTGKLTVGFSPNLLKSKYTDFQSFLNGASVGGYIQNGTATADTSDFYVGDRSLKMVASAANNYAFLGTSVGDFNIRLEASTKYILSCYAKASAGTPSIALYIRQDDTVTKTSGSAAITTSWVRYEFSVTTDANLTDSGIVRVHNLTSGATVWFDAIQVEKASSAASPEAQPYTPSATVEIYGGQIEANTITASEILAGTITADEITGTTLSAIYADLGTITAGTAKFLDSATNWNSWADPDTATGIVLGYDVGNDVGKIIGYSAGTAQAYFAGDGKLYAGGGIVSLNENGVEIVAGTGAPNKVSWLQSTTNIATMWGYYNAGDIVYFTINAQGYDVSTPNSQIVISADYYDDTYNTYIMMDTNVGFQFLMNANRTARFGCIDGGSYIKLGVNTTPSTTFHVLSATDAEVRIETSGAGDPTLSFKTTNTAHQVNIYLDESVASDQLFIAGQTAAVDTLLSVLALTGENAYLISQVSGKSPVYWGQYSSGHAIINNSDQDSDIIIQVNKGGSAYTAMRIDGVTGGVAIGTATAGGRLRVLEDINATLNNEYSMVYLDRNSSGTPAAGFGGAIQMRLESTTTNNRNAARLAWQWTTATDASRRAEMNFYVSDNSGENEALRLKAVGGSVELESYGHMAFQGTKKVTGLAAAANAGDAISYGQINWALGGGGAISGNLDMLTGSLDMNANDISNIGAVLSATLTTTAIASVGTNLSIGGALDHNGSTIGFYGVAPQARSTGWAATNWISDKVLDANSTTLAELADVVATIMNDLALIGIFGV